MKTARHATYGRRALRSPRLAGHWLEAMTLFVMLDVVCPSTLPK